MRSCGSDPSHVDTSVSSVLGPPRLNRIPSDVPIPIPSCRRSSQLKPAPSTVHKSAVSVVWFRGHDLRVHDHAALDAAVASGGAVVALYVLECGAETEGVLHYDRHRRVTRLHDTRTAPHSPPHRPYSSAPSHFSDISDSSIHANSSSQSPLAAARAPSSSPSTESSPPGIRLECQRTPWGPLSPNGGFALGRVQRWYLHHSLCVLRHQLHQLGITLVLRRVDCADDNATQVTSVVNALGANVVFWNKRYKPRAYPVDEAVKSSLRKLGVHAQDLDSETLMEPSMTSCGRYDDFQSYTRFWIDSMRACPPPRPSLPIDKSDVNKIETTHISHLLAHADSKSLSGHSSDNCANKPLPDVADLGLLEGLSLEGLDAPGKVEAIGCTAARRALAAFLRTDRFSRFASGGARRDGMVTGKDLATSRLSPHVRFGEISPRVLFYEIVDAGAAAEKSGNQDALEASRTFLKNMSLREFGYYMLARYPSAAYKPIMPEFEAFPWQEDDDGALTHAWETGTTGFPIVDAAMRQLLREGWMHNRMRFLAASFFCKYLLLPWPVGAAHLVRTLVDGDEACNSLGWQWTMGCNSDSFPFSTLVNPLSLYTHTQSRRRAADYIRRYVPELAHLPDRLVFTPWKANEQERAAFRLNIVSPEVYVTTDRNSRLVPAQNNQSVYYPARLVTGKEARFRARRAMEVMRRIFAAQRQCRTIIAEQSLPIIREISEEDDRPRCTEKVTKRPKVIDDTCAVLCNDAAPAMDTCDADASASFVTDVRMETTSEERKRKEASGTQFAPSEKRRRTAPDDHVYGKQESPQSPRMQASSVLSIAELSTPPLHTVQVKNGMDSSAPIPKKLKSGPLRHSAEPIVPGMERPRNEVPHPKVTSSKSSKRPRPTTPKLAQSTSDRLSVKSLLSPSLTNEIGTLHQTSPSSLLQAARRSPAETRSGMDALPRLAQVAACQTPAPGASSVSLSQEPQHLAFAEHVGQRISGSASRAIPDAASTSSPAPVQTAGFSPSRNWTGHSGTVRDAIRTATPRNLVNGHHYTSGGMSHSHMADFRYRQASDVVNPTQRHSSRSHNDNLLHPPTSSHVAARHPERKVEVVSTMHAYGGHGGQPSPVFHPGVAPVPLPILGNQYQSPQHPNPQMMMPFRPPHSHMSHSHMTHTGHSAPPTPSASQTGYFASGHVGANPHQAPGQQVLWYPAMPPYLELQSAGLPGAVMPQMVHPMPRQHAHGIPVGYQLPGTGNVGAPGDPSRMPHQTGLVMPFCETETARQGPSSPMERENIARRMAAMDYHDDNYGGKHWEQWQAIALHLLNQYEFSEDTDRETSRAYVRLCVLKDELRDANPTGPRVTVNHCKEVFRILKLPVTGEWDRRGHGGVRGPYVYGCVKKSGNHSSRR